PPGAVETSEGTQKVARAIAPSGASAGLGCAKPRWQAHIGPPCGLSGFDVSGNSLDCVPSVILSAMPTMPTIHIQKSAPGPPSEIAIATPAMLPRPTVAESAVERA